MTEPTKPTKRKARHIECSMEDYHARDETSRSQIEDLLDSPPLFYGRHIARPPIYPRKSSKDFDTGTVAHAALSAPRGLDTVVTEIPAEVLNGQGHRKGARWQEWAEAHAGTIHLKAEELEPIRQMVRNVYDHPEAGQLLGKVMHYEFSLVWDDAETGLPLRARPDLILRHRDGAVVADFKTTKALTPREFAADAAKYGYHRQEAWYREGVELFGLPVVGFVFITVDKSPAHECRVYDLPPSALQLGREENQANRRDLARRLDTNDWTDPYGKEILTVDLPEWAYKDPWRM